MDKLTSCYRHIKTLSDIDKGLLSAIEHFFTHYKDLEAGKWTKVRGFDEVEVAKGEILASVKRYREKTNLSAKKQGQQKGTV